MLTVVYVGAIIDDGFTCLFDHRLRREIFARWLLSRAPDFVARSEMFFARHGDKSAFIARFTRGEGAVVPLFAGILRMPMSRFDFASILSALVWTPSHILPDVLVDASLSVFGAAAEPLANIALLLIILSCLLQQVARLPSYMAASSNWPTPAHP